MKIRCVGRELTEHQRKVLGFQAWENPHYEMTPGKIYTVLGITAKPDYMAGAVVQLLDDGGRCLFAPISLFEVVDGRLSKFWRAKLLNEHTLALWPEEFYADYFHDDLSEGERSSVDTFARVVAALEQEANDH